MLLTISLAILFALVIAGGVMTILKSMKKENVVMGEATCLKHLKDIQDHNKYVGSSMIGVGAVGLLLVGYMEFSGHKHGHHGSDTGANFGFKFY
jgi:hypothetical protein